MWPWWIVPVYFGLRFLHAATEPIDWPLRYFCLHDMWGNQSEQCEAKQAPDASH